MLRITKSHYPGQGIYIRHKLKIVLELSNYATKKELNNATGADTFNVAAKRDFTALKAEVDTLDINKLDNVPTGLKNLKTKVNDLDVGKLKIVHVELKKLSDVVSKEVVKITKFTKLNTKVKHLENKIPHAATLICINQ